MMIRAATLRAIANGTVTQAFRRWEVPRVRPGGTQRTAIGVVAFDAVEPVNRDILTEEDARTSGFGSLDELLAMLDRKPAGEVYRVRLRMQGPDPRLALRESVPDREQLADIGRRLERLDRASHHGSWTHDVLRAIGAGEGVRAAELAAGFGREKMAFKLDVRKLKELGLTESLRPGYRLSPRGRAVLAALDASAARR
jgi:hypothetical protein